MPLNPRIRDEIECWLGRTNSVASDMREIVIVTRETIYQSHELMEWADELLARPWPVWRS